MSDYFDIEAYFEERGIDYHKAGEKNVTKGWVNIECPFDDCDDPSWHCGINLTTRLFNCYICGRKGQVVKIVQELENCSYAAAHRILDQYQNPFLKNRQNEALSTWGEPYGRDFLEQEERRRKSARILPRESTEEFPRIHLSYIEKRRFNPQKLISKYQLKACHNIGPYKFRIIIPVFLDKRLVSFTAKDITDKSPIPYKHCPEDKSLVPINHCLYNIDSVKESMVIMEGAFDAWRFGDGAVCTFGINWTDEQSILASKKKIKRAFIFFDAGTQAQKRAKRLARRINSVIDEIEIISLREGDPDSLFDNEIITLKRDLGF